MGMDPAGENFKISGFFVLSQWVPYRIVIVVLWCSASLSATLIRLAVRPSIFRESMMSWVFFPVEMRRSVLVWLVLAVIRGRRFILLHRETAGCLCL